jgi:AcrR family transcriptional regulator
MPGLAEKKKEMVEELMRKALYKAAASVMTDYGWHGLTMDKVAERAGVSKGTLYNYFRDKEDLVKLVMIHFTSDVEEKIKTIINDNDSGLEALKEIIREGLDSLRSKTKLGLAFEQAILEESELGRKLQYGGQILSSISTLIRKLIAGGVENGEFREVDPVVMEAVLSSMLVGISHQWDSGKLDRSAAEMSDFVISILENGLIRKG